MAETLLDIRGLKTWFKTDDGMVRAVDGVDLHIDRGETWAWWANRAAARP